MLRQAREFREPFFGGELRFMRMDANGRIDPIVLLGERDSYIETIGRRAASDGEDFLDAGVACARQHGVAVSVKLRKFQMRVRIDDLQKDPLGGGRPGSLMSPPRKDNSAKKQSAENGHRKDEYGRSWIEIRREKIFEKVIVLRLS